MAQTRRNRLKGVREVSASSFPNEEPQVGLGTVPAQLRPLSWLRPFFSEQCWAEFKQFLK